MYEWFEGWDFALIPGVLVGLHLCVFFMAPTNCRGTKHNGQIPIPHASGRFRSCPLKSQPWPRKGIDICVCWEMDRSFLTGSYIYIYRWIYMDYECKRVGCLSSQLYKHINMPVHVYIYKWCYSGTVLNGIWVMTIEPGKKNRRRRGICCPSKFRKKQCRNMLKPVAKMNACNGVCVCVMTHWL